MVLQHTQEYIDSIKALRDQCVDSGIEEDEFRKIYFEELQRLEERKDIQPTTPTSREMFSTKYKVLFVLLIVLGCSVYHYKTIYSSVVCHLQEYIYPGLRLLRKISIPFLSLFPSLTHLYHETCLIQNPFFTVVDMDCWPCSSVNIVGEVQNPKPGNQHFKAPFIYETEQQLINLNLLREIYHKNKAIFDREPSEILIDSKYYTTPEEVFTNNKFSENKLFVWKFVNIHVARILRQFISRPIIVPKFGQSTERFIIIDSSQKAFKVPDTECSYSFLLSLSGTRTINLVPAEECKHHCKSLQVELKETYLLWYNWWYWRPVVQQSAGNVTFIAHVGSYC